MTTKNGALEKLDIQFDKNTLLELHQFLTLVNHEKLEFIQNKQIVFYQKKHLNVSEILEKLSKLSDKHLSKISTPFDLKQSIVGILCRERFMLNAKNQKLHEASAFQDQFEKEKKKSMIKFVLNRLKKNQVLDENEETDKEKYFQFRTILLSKSDVLIDSAMVKNFIL